MVSIDDLEKLRLAASDIVFSVHAHANVPLHNQPSATGFFSLS